MITIRACALPSSRLRGLCHWGEQCLRARLAPAQRRHLRRFSPAALPARASRILARLLLLMHARPMAPLDMDEQGRPILPGLAAGFSHSGLAAFCVIGSAAHGQGVAMDAEALPADRHEHLRAWCGSFGLARASCDLALKLWTIYETAMKMPRLRASAARIMRGLRHIGGEENGHLFLGNQKFFWRLASSGGHLACAGALASIPPLAIDWVDLADIQAAAGQAYEYF